MPNADEEVKRSARVLTGFMPLPVAKGFAQSFALDPQGFGNAWQAQQAALPKPLSAAYTPVKAQPLPPAAVAHVNAIKANPLFSAVYGANADFKMVELGRLIACQYWVDTHVSGNVHGAGMQPQPTLSELLDKCLPLDIIPQAKVFYQQLPNGLIAYSMNNTLQLKGPGFDPTTAQINFALGPNANLMLVREHAGRHILTNGYHRAWLLRSKRVTMVPALVWPAATQDEVVLGPDFVLPATLFGARPPTIDDFFDNALSADVEVRAIFKAVKITIEDLFVPRLL